MRLQVEDVPIFDNRSRRTRPLALVAQRVSPRTSDRPEHLGAVIAGVITGFVLGFGLHAAIWG